MPHRHARKEYTPRTERLVNALDTFIEWRQRTPRLPWAQRTARRHEARIRARLILDTERPDLD